MKKALLSLLALMLLACSTAYADTHILEIKTDKIVLHTDSLGLPESTCAYDILSMVPDLIERNNEYVYENYDLQVNGKTVGNARDAILQQIRISDLKFVEISENSLSSVTSMGEGGSINLVLRDLDRETSGAANVEATTEANYTGGFTINHKKEKWTVRGIASFENYMPRAFYTYGAGGRSTEFTEKDFTQLATTFIEYQPTEKDLFKLNVSEIYTNFKENKGIYDEGTFAYDTHNRTHGVNAFFGFNYDHTFQTDGKWCFELNYRYIPEDYDGHGQSIESTYDHKAYNLAGTFKVIQPFFKPTDTHSVKMEMGVQYNFVKGTNDSENRELGSKGEPDNELDVTERTFFFRPYVRLDAKVKKWDFMGTIDYQNFAYDTKMDNDDREEHNLREDVTGQAIVMYTPSPRHVIRARYMRTINRPSSTQLFPYSFKDPVSETVTIGNADLSPMKQNAFSLDYDLDLSGSGYKLQMRACVEYMHNYNMITASELSGFATTYSNIGTSDVIMGDYGVSFRKDFFSAWLSSNVFHKMDDYEENGERDHHTYYNILFRPVFRLGKGWLVSCDAVYNSKVKESSQEMGSLFYGGMRIAKNWKHFNVYVFGTKKFNGNERDVVYGKFMDETSSVEYIHEYVGAGVRYSF